MGFLRYFAATILTLRPVQVAWIGGGVRHRSDVEGVRPERLCGLRTAADVGELHLIGELLDLTRELERDLGGRVTDHDLGAFRDGGRERSAQRELTLAGCGGRAAAGAEQGERGCDDEQSQAGPPARSTGMVQHE